VSIEQLIAGGLRNAKAARCPTCGAPTLVGYDGDLAALKVRVDPIPLTPVGEAMAQLADRHTYAARRRGHGIALHRRDRWQIGGARRKRFDVVAAHICGDPLAEFSTPSTIATPRRPLKEHHEPPF
jgi:hypothetical protein